ncbi:MAG: PAS domain S-box protein [Planctomycetota bacterium]
MTSQPSPSSSAQSLAIIAAIERTMPVIEFKPDGTIVRANDLFLKATGYSLKEIQGKHHRIFMKADDAAKPAYGDFWSALAAGQSISGQMERVTKSGGTIWMEASYTPVKDDRGSTVSVIKFAHDITAARKAALGDAAKLNAIDRTMAVIEFQPDGTILQANAAFLAVMGYTEAEIKGQHHRMFVTKDELKSLEYAGFWKALADGKPKSGQFHRLHKSGKSVWLEANYNPVLDLDGRVERVVKFAIDITEKVEMARATEVALRQSREAERIREELDRALEQMSTPVMPIWDGILLLPLIGVVDSSRTDNAVTKTLERINETRSKVFLLDISGVPAVDTAVANQLLKITKATQLMGCETLISGLSPSIARTMVELGVQVGEVRTTATLRDAFAIALRKVNGNVVASASA